MKKTEGEGDGVKDGGRGRIFSVGWVMTLVGDLDCTKVTVGIDNLVSSSVQN